MRAGLVRNAALGMVALVGLGLAGCDDNPTDFDPDDTTHLRVNPTVMTVPAGVTSRLDVRTENAGNEPTWEEVSWQVDSSCGSASITVDEHPNYVPDVEPPAVLGVTGGTTLGEVCIQLTGGGADANVEVIVVGDSLAITGAPDSLNINETVDLGAVLLSDDGSPVSPFDDATDIVWSSDNEEALTVDEDGVVTAVGIGGASITATWTDFGVTQSASVSISVNAPTLEILNVPDPDSVLIFTSVDLDVQLVNPTDPPADFGPFDQNTDVTWSSSDEDVMSVDPATGEVTSEGAGTATITVEWNANPTVFATVDLSTDIPAPDDLTSADAASYGTGDMVTLTGVGFIPGAHSVIVEGEAVDDLLEGTIVDATTATFVMPGGAVGEVSITIGVEGGAQSNAITVDRLAAPDEPANDDPGTAPGVALPVDFYGFVDADDPDDFFEFTIGAETTFDMFLDWTGGADLDLIISNAAVDDFPCFAASTAHPEEGSCTLEAGTWYLWINDYDGVPATYHVQLTP